MTVESTGGVGIPQGKCSKVNEGKFQGPERGESIAR